MKTQRDYVVDVLKQQGHITDLEAYREFGIRRLSGIIFNLRKEYNIETEDIKEKNRFGREVIFAKYIYRGVKVSANQQLAIL